MSALLRPRPDAASQSLLATPGLELSYSGRAALYAAFREIAAQGRTEVLIPGYHCPSCVTPALEAGLKPVFYRIRRDLSVDREDLLSKAGSDTAAVLLIHFFGIATELDWLQPLRQTGVALLEDWSHSFLQGDPPRLAGSDADSDYRVYSFWKIAPIGVGGGLWRSPERRARSEWLTPPRRERVVHFKRMFEEALESSEHRRLQQLFQRIEQWRVGRKLTTSSSPDGSVDDGPDASALLAGEAHYPFVPRLVASSMPSLARRMLAASDFRDIARRRRANYQVYAEQLDGSGPVKPLIPDAPADACPWVFPVLVERRNERDHLWRARGVALHTFGIYLHSQLAQADAQTLADAVYLAEHCLCLAVHQDLDREQIAASAALLRQDPLSPP
ncbi:DegT/DnrJ/EryC1/StrS family aminotransferase [Pelomonas sp. SE-A7]|uniref:DegT/DnrJ/EryC1/StrS family aminotransferase n=1 Tax=Pelomonas sp. SE-A7 TaxID=3054953 RepID=UPI00259D240B|nr:DegT/DnrJ/EryC1/StrS family aminotransferase [Pelomonas sp. SE-A7]MDM4764901.1 DegT/DnrJ/EryC1/StrS family aminotransferase [Pelomonas sp. SE-A7]